MFSKNLRSFRSVFYSNFFRFIYLYDFSILNDYVDTSVFQIFQEIL